MLISLMLLVSNGGTVFADNKTVSVVPDSLTQNATPQSSLEELPNLQFEIIAPNVGWLATAERLYWTESNGATWQDITPSALNLPIVKVEFVDAKLGWLVALDPSAMPVSIAVLQTSDGGATWQDKSSNLQKVVNEIDFPLSTTIYSQFEPDGQGWLLIKYATGVNFSLGTLLYTSDPGSTWERREAQSGEPFRFVDRKHGYQLAAHGSGLLYTQDGGMTWQTVDLAIAGLEADAQIQPGLPLVTGDGGLVIPVHSYREDELAKTYLLESLDEGKSWVESTTVLEPTQAVLRGEPVLETISESGELTQWQPVVFTPAEGGQPKTTSDPIALDHLALTRLVSSDGQNAWGLFSGGGCLTGENSPEPTCLQGQVLAVTSDGGLTWSLMQLPEAVAVLVETQPVTPEFGKALQPDATTDATTNWQLIKAQGFDTCAAVNMTRMSTWRASSPYSVYGLYLGGSMAYCPNTVFDATSLRVLFNAGWRFIPTWVGPQAPCSSFRDKFSLNTTTAYNQGIDNANQAVEAVKTRGMTNPDGSGSVIYYDLESFLGDTACTEAVRSFLKGWTTRLHQTGNKSGLYATSRNLDNNKIYTIAPVPDVVWIAEWYWTPYFRDWVTVFNVDYLANSYWANHQRIYQYAGGHAETWGGLTMSIDSNVIDGMVAVPYSSDITLPVSKLALSGTPGTNGWYRSAISVTLTATDNVSGINAIYYDLNGTGWKKYTAPISVTANQTNVLQYRAVDGVYNWESPQSVTFKLDSTAPGFPTGLKSRCPYPGLKQAFCNDEAFSWVTATDNLSGLYQTYRYWGTDPNGTSSILATTSFDPSPIADRSTYYLRFRTVDNAGNSSGWRTLYTLSYDTRFNKLQFLPLVTR